MGDALTASSDSVNTDVITAVGLEKHIDIYILRVNTCQHIKDATFSGYNCGSAVVLCQNGGQLLRGHIVHIQPHRHDLPEIGQLYGHILQILHLRLSFDNHFLQVTLLLFQNPFFHTAAFHNTGVLLVVLCFKTMDSASHMADNRRLSF